MLAIKKKNKTTDEKIQISLKHEHSETFSTVLQSNQKTTWESNLVLKRGRWEERGWREVVLHMFCHEILKQRAVLKQCGLSIPGAGSSP